MSVLERQLDVLLPRGGAVAVILEAYIDESGCDDYSKVLAVGGYLLEASKAKRMEKAWVRVLRQYGVQAFHMVDCAHGNGAFADMPKAKRSLLAAKLFALIERYVRWGFAFACPPQRHVAADRVGDPYTFCLTNCCMALNNIINDQIFGENLTIFFEAGHKSSGQAVSALADFQSRGGLKQLSSYSFTKKEDSTLLQAADILVWQFAKHIKDKVFNERPTRKDFIELTKSEHTLFYGYSGADRSLFLMDYEPHVDNESRDRQVRELFGGVEFSDPALKGWEEMSLPPGSPQAYSWGRPPSPWPLKRYT